MCGGWHTPESWMAFTSWRIKGTAPSRHGRGDLCGGQCLDFLWELEWGQEDDGQSLVLSVVHCPWLV